MTVQTDPNTQGPWTIYDRNGAWDCGSLADASGTCNGVANASIAWTK